MRVSQGDGGQEAEPGRDGQPRGAPAPHRAGVRGHRQGRGVANSHEDVVDEGPAARSFQHVVDPVLQAAVALVRSRGALAAGGARA